MDNTLFLQQLRDLSLEDGRAFIREHAAELADHAAFGVSLADEALDKLFIPFVSLKLAELLIFFGEYVSHSCSLALGLKARGDALVQIGHYQAAMDSLQAAGDIFLQLGDEGNWARSRISWIISVAWLGRVEEALEEAARARDIFSRHEESDWVCSIDLNTALIYDHVGRYEDALKLYENMQATYSTLSDQSENLTRVIAMAKGNQAIQLASLGNFERAYHLQQLAQASFNTLGETVLTINAEVDLADLDYAQSYYGSALRRYFQARDSLIQNNLDDPRLLAELKLRIANCLVKLNRAQEACSLSNEAVELNRRFGLSLSTGNALREYATALVASGRFQEALNSLDEAWTLLSHGQFDPLAYATKLQQAELLLKMGSVTASYEEASIAKEYFKTKGLVAPSNRASLLMADALIKIAQQARLDGERELQTISLQEALLLCKQIVLQGRQYNLQEEIYKSHYLLGQIFALQGNVTGAAKHYGSAIVQVERILDDLMYDLSPAFLHTTWAVYEDMIALCLQQSQFERAFSYLEQARSMALRQYLNKSKTLSSERRDQETTSSFVLPMNNAAILHTRYKLRQQQEEHRYYSVLLEATDSTVSSVVDREVIQKEQKRCEENIKELSESLDLYQSASYAQPHMQDSHTRRAIYKQHAKRNIQRIDIAQLRRQLAPDQLLLAYFLYKGNLVIFAATTEQLVTREITDGAARLELLLLQLHGHLQPAGWPNPQQPAQQRICRLLSKFYTILVAPIAELLPAHSGNLTIVPYGLLHELPFEALHDGSHFLIENFQVNYLPTSNLLMHFASHQTIRAHDAADESRALKPPLVFGYSGNGHLKRTIDEAKMLAEMLNGQCYLESEATIARLIEQAQGSPIIHIATHGHSRLDSPNFSYVLLADGQLNAIDAFNLDLKGCELVTLSGCETGKAFIGGGDEQLGLGRAFLAAGAESLVMSLWPVEDNATNELMRCFYQQLLQGSTKVQALQSAQCSLLQRTGSMYTHPYFWAAFRLVGDVGPLKYQRAEVQSSPFVTHLPKK